MVDRIGKGVARFTVSALMALFCTACLVQTPTREGADEGSAIGGTEGGGSAALPEDYVEAEVVDVIDGDTIRVLVEGEVQAVRYIGIDAPERDEPLGPASTEANEALVAGRTVALERDVSQTDDHGRWLRYVYLPDGLMVNAEMVRLGLADARAYPPDVSRQARLMRMEQEARAAARGLWQHSGTTPEPAGPRVRILAVDKQAEVVDLINLGVESADLTGWRLVSERGGEVCRLAGSLEPAASLRVWAREQDADRVGYNCGFEGNVWNNSEPDTAALYDARGRLVDVFP